MEMENEGRGPHFVSAQRDDASVIRAQVTDQYIFSITILRHDHFLGPVASLPCVKYKM